MCPITEDKLMRQERVICRQGYLIEIEISRISESLRDHADGATKDGGS